MTGDLDPFLIRRKIVRKYARAMGRTGKPIRCVPSQRELSGEVARRVPADRDGQIIFDSYDQAWDCARELESSGTPKMRVDRCPRHRAGHIGHYHVFQDRDLFPTYRATMKPRRRR